MILMQKCICVAGGELSTMPRYYYRKTDFGKASHAAMLEAVRLVREDGVSVRKVAEMKGVSKSALSRYVMKQRNDENARLEPN
jgi:hypothetical protein